MNEESIGLLQACDSGTKTGMNSIRAVLDKVRDVELLRLLTHSMETHEKLGKEIMALLETAQQEVAEHEQEPEEMPLPFSDYYLEEGKPAMEHEIEKAVDETILP